MDDIAHDLAKRLDALFLETMTGPVKKQRQTALRVRGHSFETVEIDDHGKVIEPPQRCCYGWVLHSPNCKTWGVMS